MKQHLSTHELADRVGIHPNTLRKWDKLGLLDPPARRNKNNHRVWEPEDVERVSRVLYPERGVGEP